MSKNLPGEIQAKIGSIRKAAYNVEASTPVSQRQQVKPTDVVPDNLFSPIVLAAPKRVTLEMTSKNTKSRQMEQSGTDDDDQEKKMEMVIDDDSRDESGSETKMKQAKKTPISKSKNTKRRSKVTPQKKKVEKSPQRGLQTDERPLFVADEEPPSKRPLLSSDSSSEEGEDDRAAVSGKKPATPASKPTNQKSPDTSPKSPITSPHPKTASKAKPRKSKRGLYKPITYKKPPATQSKSIPTKKTSPLKPADRAPEKQSKSLPVKQSKTGPRTKTKIAKQTTPESPTKQTETVKQPERSPTRIKQVKQSKTAPTKANQIQISKTVPDKELRDTKQSETVSISPSKPKPQAKTLTEKSSKQAKTLPEKLSKQAESPEKSSKQAKTLPEKSLKQAKTLPEKLSKQAESASKKSPPSDEATAGSSSQFNYPPMNPQSPAEMQITSSDSDEDGFFGLHKLDTPKPKSKSMKAAETRQKTLQAKTKQLANDQENQSKAATSKKALAKATNRLDIQTSSVNEQEKVKSPAKSNNVSLKVQKKKKRKTLSMPRRNTKLSTQKTTSRNTKGGENVSASPKKLNRKKKVAPKSILRPQSSSSDTSSFEDDASKSSAKPVAKKTKAVKKSQGSSVGVAKQSKTTSSSSNAANTVGDGLRRSKRSRAPPGMFWESKGYSWQDNSDEPDIEMSDENAKRSKASSNIQSKKKLKATPPPKETTSLRLLLNAMATPMDKDKAEVSLSGLPTITHVKLPDSLNSLLGLSGLEDFQMVSDLRDILPRSKNEGTEKQDDGFRFATTLVSPLVDCGFVRISPGSSKGMQVSTTKLLTFLVLSSEVEVEVNEETKVTLCYGHNFVIPPGMKYDIKNVGSTPALINYQSFSMTSNDDD